MRSRSPLAAVAITLALGAAACQKPDVGGQCNIAWGDSTPSAPTAATTTADYFESGNLACDGLVCIISPAPAGVKYGSEGNVYGSDVAGQGYCSKPCVSNSDCYESETGLVCRQMVLDPVFLETLDAATRARYLADIQYSSYCAVPR